ncbi:uncharacterized protein [Branchiostoma lanceolatum]|uniref:uncharacterized protein n=1 Tax=Branchiostoma lanceolatum TaxID=7740 RepID=UPI0034525AB0
MMNGKASDVINQNDVISHNDVPEELMSVVASLTSERRYVPQWYVYDTRGSEMCEELIRKSKTYKVWQHEYSIRQTHVDDTQHEMATYPDGSDVSGIGPHGVSERIRKNPSSLLGY